MPSCGGNPRSPAKHTHAASNITDMSKVRRFKPGLIMRQILMGIAERLRLEKWKQLAQIIRRGAAAIFANLKCLRVLNFVPSLASIKLDELGSETVGHVLV